MNPTKKTSATSDPNAGQAVLVRRRVCWSFARLILAALLGAALTQYADSWLIVVVVLMGLWLAVSLFNRYFFRDPPPKMPIGDGLVIAPAHGHVDCVEKMYEPEFIKGPAQRISISLSVCDVNVQYAPLAGRIKLVRHRPGIFLNALRSDSANWNESMIIGFESLSEHGERWVVRQIAGTIARRIETWVKEGDLIQFGHRLGMIRYGSRCDVYLPLSSKISVKPGEKVVGGQTVIAVCNPEAS